MKPGDLDEYYEIDFEQDPDHIDENSHLDDSDIMDQVPEFDENGFMNMLQDVNSCGVQIVYKYNITNEVKHIYDQVVHPEILAELENHEKEELRETIHDIVGPMFDKLMGSPQAGEMVVDNLSEEIVNWIKDTIIMLVKHHGNVDGYEFKEYGVEETMMSKEECDAVHAPTFALYEEANANLTLKLAKSEDDHETCTSAEAVYLAEIDDINKEKDELETIAETQLERLKSDLKRVKGELNDMTELYVELNNTKATESNETASKLLQKCRSNFRKAHKVCYDKLNKCEDDLEDEEDETKKLIKTMRIKHKKELEGQEDAHNNRVRSLKAQMREEKADFDKSTKNQDKDLKFQKKIISSLTKKYNQLETIYEKSEEKLNSTVEKYNDTIAELTRKLKRANKKIDALHEKLEDHEEEEEPTSTTSEDDYSNYDASGYKYTYNYRKPN